MENGREVDVPGNRFATTRLAVLDCEEFERVKRDQASSRGLRWSLVLSTVFVVLVGLFASSSEIRLAIWGAVLVPALSFILLARHRRCQGLDQQLVFNAPAEQLMQVAQQAIAAATTTCRFADVALGEVGGITRQGRLTSGERIWVVIASSGGSGRTVTVSSTNFRSQELGVRSRHLRNVDRVASILTDGASTGA